jgi:hypothetical protein
MCGVGSYTDYLVRHLDRWNVTSFETDLPNDAVTTSGTGRVSYELSLGSGTFPFSGDKHQLVWFQHAFGIWGQHADRFTDLVGRVKREGLRTAATFHTIHFESNETEEGLTVRERRLMGAVLPLLDIATVFSDGARRALTAMFPQFAAKIVVLRHGTHIYPAAGRAKARRKLLRHLADRAQSITNIADDLLSPTTIILGNFGFVTPDKDPLALYEIGAGVRSRLPGRRVVTLYVGTIAGRADRAKSETSDLLQQLQRAHDGRDNLFFDVYLPEDLLPFAFRAVDLCMFWCRNATQSGRIAHAMGSRTCVVGRRIEGIGETLDLAGLLSVLTVDDLVEQSVRLILDPEARRRAERLGVEYAERYSFEKQARKHALLCAALDDGHEFPVLDRTEPDVTFVLPSLGIASTNGLEAFQYPDVAILNVADDVDFHPASTVYGRIALKDGTAIPVEKMREAVEWIRKHIADRRVIVTCRYGRGRSVSVAIGYLCSAGMPYGDAVNRVVRRRAGAAPLPKLAQTIELLYGSKVVPDGHAKDASTCQRKAPRVVSSSSES